MKINYKKKELLSQEETSMKEVEFAVEDAKLQLQSDILATKKSLENSKAALQDAKNTYPLDTARISNLISEVEGFEKGIKVLEDLQKEFGFVK